MITDTMQSTEGEGFSIDAVPNPAAAYADYYDGEDGRDSMPCISIDKDLVVEEHPIEDVKDSSAISVTETNEEESTAALPSPLDADPATVADEKDSDLEFSSSSSSSSEDSSSDGDSSSSDAEESEEETDKKANKKVAQDDFDDDGEPLAKGVPKTKNEIDTLPPIDDTPIDDIPPDAPLTLVGSVTQTIEGLVIVQAQGSGEIQVLDADSVLVTEDRIVAGRIFETFGPVTNPLYSLRLPPNSTTQLPPGTLLYTLPTHSSVILTSPLKNLKGSDASNLFDEEIGVEELEFSDDEAEAAFKKSLKMKKRGRALDRRVDDDVTEEGEMEEDGEIDEESGYEPVKKRRQQPRQARREAPHQHQRQDRHTPYQQQRQQVERRPHQYAQQSQRYSHLQGYTNYPPQPYPPTPYYAHPTYNTAQQQQHQQQQSTSYTMSSSSYSGYPPPQQAYAYPAQYASTQSYESQRQAVMQRNWALMHSQGGAQGYYPTAQSPAPYATVYSSQQQALQSYASSSGSVRPVMMPQLQYGVHPMYTQYQQQQIQQAQGQGQQERNEYNPAKGS